MRELEGPREAANRATGAKGPARSERSTRPASRPQASRGTEPSGPLPNFTRRSRFFKASFRRRAYYMNRSLSLSFTDRALPSAIRPGGVSHSRLARGARGFPPALRRFPRRRLPIGAASPPRLPSRGGEAHRGVSLPASQRTAAASHRGGPTFRRGNCRGANRARPRSNPPLAAQGQPGLRYHVVNRQEGTRHARNPAAEAYRASVRRLDKEVHSHVRAARRQRLHI